MAMNKRIMVGMSGGVDSSVAALLLLQQGYDVQGLFMKNWEEDDRDGFCAASIDVADAQDVCDQLGIILHTVNFATEYWQQVFENFLEEYRLGRTPNPDILCNKEIKFKAFLEHARELGADSIATGHYARCEIKAGQAYLLKGTDKTKDQSYFLYTLQQNQLLPSIFPLGDLTKLQIREMAKLNKFANHAKKDSTGICFIGERKFKDFLSQYLPTQPGNIVTVDGKIVAEHQGLMYYTLGQRQGLGIGGRKDAAEKPWYVYAKDIKQNLLIVGQEKNHALLLSSRLNCDKLHWVAGQAPAEKFPCTAKTRYRQSDQACTVQQIDNEQYKVEFSEPQWAVTPGQSVVFYQNEICLGGGIIN